MVLSFTSVLVCLAALGVGGTFAMLFLMTDATLFESAITQLEHECIEFIRYENGSFTCVPQPVSMSAIINP